MSDDIYCGAGKVPKGKRKGTLEECIEKNQIRLYGLIQTSDREIKDLKGTKGSLKSKHNTISKKFLKLYEQIAKYKHEVRRLEQAIIVADNRENQGDKPKKLRAELDKLHKDITPKQKEYESLLKEKKKLEEEMKKEQLSKAKKKKQSGGSKKRSKKTSTKKRKATKKSITSDVVKTLTRKTTRK